MTVKNYDFSLILKFIPDPVIVLNLENPSNVFINDHFTNMFGYDEPSIQQKPLVDLISEDYAQIAVEEALFSIHEYSSGEKIKKFTCHVINVDNSEIYCEINIDKVDHYVIFHFRDLRTQRQFEEKIVEKNLQLKLQKMELTKLNEELNIERNKAYEAARAKSEFLANMSHEIRTPLNSVIGFAGILSKNRDNNLSQKQLKQIGNIIASGNHLLTLVNDLLDLAKVESGKMELLKEEISLLSLINEVLSSVELMAVQKGLELQFHYNRDDESVKKVMLDVKRFKQILYNLLSNAIKFTEVGSVTVLLERKDKKFIQFSVTDTGIGIDKKDYYKVFEEFKQIDSSTSRQYDGTGLGLALTKKFVNLHGGQIWFTSEVNSGSTFCFTLPSDLSAH